MLASMLDDPRPLIAHVMYRLATGGLENGIVNLIVARMASCNSPWSDPHAIEP